MYSDELLDLLVYFPLPVAGVYHDVVLRALAELLEEGRDDENDDDIRRDDAERRNKRTDDACGGEAHVCRHVDADGAGRGLSDGDHIGDLLMGEPAGFIGDIIVKRERGKASADGEHAGFEKLPEQAQEDHAFTSRRFRTMPATAARMT